VCTADGVAGGGVCGCYGRHSTACHNTSGQLRVAAQNRWTPYWLNGGLGGNQLTLPQWEALPAGLQPLLRHQW
jgi:hypothetical protein